MLLVLVLDATKDRDRILDTRLADHDRLEPAGQSLVLLDVLVVLVQGRSTDCVKDATGQSRLQDVACIHRAFRGTGTHNRVQLIDEENDLAVRLLDFLEDALEPVLELATVLGASHECAHIELDELLVAQGGRHIAVNDTLGQALDDSGLADTRLAD